MGMACDEVEPMIGFLLDNELDPVQSLEVEQHLETCEACRTLLQEQGSLRDVLRRAAASIDTPYALRDRIRLSMQRERRSQVGLARAWPAAVAAAILISFVWHGQSAQTLSALSQVSQAHARQIPMDVTSNDPQVVAHYLHTQLSYPVPVASIVAAVGASKPQQMAARIIERDGQQQAFIRLDCEHGTMTLLIGNTETEQAESATADAHAQANLAPSFSAKSPRFVAQPLYMAQDAKGLTVAQWHSRGLVYDMVSDLPHAQLTASVQQMAR